MMVSGEGRVGIGRNGLLLIALIVFAFLSVQVAVAGQGGGGKTASHGKKHAKSSKQQLRELRQELQALRGQVAVLQGQSGDPATPTGAAGGDLAGSYPNPRVAANAIETAEVVDGSLTDADVNPLNVDGAAGTPSLRTLGSAAGQALAGNASAGGDLTGSYPNPTVGLGVLTDANVAAANLDGAAGTPSLRTLGFGAAQAMPGNATPGGPPTGAAGGGLTGTYPNPTIANGAVHASDLFTTTVRQSGLTTFPESSFTTLDQSCNAGERLLSGGWHPSSTGTSFGVHSIGSWPVDANTWRFQAFIEAGTGSKMFNVRVLCLQA